MIEVRKKFITNGRNLLVRTLPRFKPVAQFYGIPEFHFTNVGEYLDGRKGIEDKTYVNFKFLDINKKIDEMFLVGDSTGEFEAGIYMGFERRGLLSMYGQEVPEFEEDMRLYDILLNKSDKKRDVIECFGLTHLGNGIYYDSDEEYINGRYAVQL